MDELQLVVEKDGVAMTDSRAIAKVFCKEHSKVMRSIRDKAHLFGQSNFGESSYINEQNKEQPMFLLDRDFTTFLIMGFTGSKADEWKLKYIEAFNKMEQRIKEQSNPNTPSTYIQALEQLLLTAKENERLLEENKQVMLEVDKYQRFLCEKTQQLKKSELAVKLDTSTQRLASKLKACGIYTKESKLSQRFLDAYPSVKMMVESENTYIINGEEKVKHEWQWTHEGAKCAVDTLVKEGFVVFTENDGFKMIK